MDGVVCTSTWQQPYSPEWLEDPFAQRIIKSVDKGVVMGSNAIKTKVLGVIPPEKLSSGTKTLLLMNFEPRVFSWCRATAYWILRIAAKKDVTINLYHLMDFGGSRFTARWPTQGRSSTPWTSWPSRIHCLRRTGYEGEHRYRQKQQGADQTAHSS